MESLSTMGVTLESIMGNQDDSFVQIMVVWDRIKTLFVVPFLRTILYICLGMTIMLFVEKVLMSTMVAFGMLFGKKTKNDKNLKSSKWTLNSVALFTHWYLFNCQCSMKESFTIFQFKLHVALNGRLIELGFKFLMIKQTN